MNRAELLGVVHRLIHPRGSDERLRRDRAGIERIAAELVAFDERHRQAQSTGRFHAPPIRPAPPPGSRNRMSVPCGLAYVRHVYSHPPSNPARRRPDRTCATAARDVPDRTRCDNSRSSSPAIPGRARTILRESQPPASGMVGLKPLDKPILRAHLRIGPQQMPRSRQRRLAVERQRRQHRPRRDRAVIRPDTARRATCSRRSGGRGRSAASPDSPGPSPAVTPQKLRP